MTLAPSDALFYFDGERYTPSELTRGPWRPDAQHGGPPSALLARAIERTEADPEMIVTRLTVELLRPVPLVALAVETGVMRPGKRVQIVVARLLAEGTEVARAQGLRLRQKALELPEGLPAKEVPPPPPGSGEPADWGAWEWSPAYHIDGVEHRFVSGGVGPGAATDWIRLRVPLVAGATTSPLCRVAAAADFGNGISSPLPWDGRWEFVNPDLTVYLHRHPVGEWVALDAETHVHNNGIGLAESRLWDEAGPLGESTQSLLLSRED
jgi:hypothetical protein